MALFLADQTTWTEADIVQVVREQLAREEDGDSFAGRLRSAVMYCPYTMPVKDFIAACVKLGVNPGTARNRYQETRNWQRELGEI